MTWDGKKRRKSDFTAGDHDTLITLVEILNSHVKNFDGHRAEFLEHLREDGRNFDKLFTHLNKGYGVIITIQFLIGLWVALKS